MLLIIAFLVVVSSALADEGAMVRRNVSGTPEFETENAQLSVAQFYIDAQRANGTLVKDEDDLLLPNEKTDDPDDILPGTLQYYAETDVPRDFESQDDLLIDERTIAKPLVITYYDEIEYDAYDADGIPDNTQASSLLSFGGELADAFDNAFDAEALASGGVPNPDQRIDAFASVSFDDGMTWKKYNLSESALRSSFTLENGIVYPGSVDYGVKSSMAGNKILVVWQSKYAMQGSPRYSLTTEDTRGIVDYGDKPDTTDVDEAPLEYYGLDGKPVTYDDLVFGGDQASSNVAVFDVDQDGDPDPVPLDIWGVAGSQGSIDYTTWMHHGLFPFAEVGEIPYSAIWTCRGVIQQTAKKDQGELVFDETTGEPVMVWDVKWRKAERLTSAKRDAMYTSIDGAENAGFSIIWQEDPEGLRPGYGEGPGEGWSGATANHKTDLWYSYILWDDFDKVENPAVDADPLDDDKLTASDFLADGVWGDYYDLDDVPDYFQTPEEVDRLGWDDTFIGPDYQTNKPQVWERMSMPQRITDNNNIVCLVNGEEPTDTGLISEDPTDLVPVENLSPVVGGSSEDNPKVVDLYAWLDLDDIDGDGLAEGDGTPDMVKGGFVWENSQGKLICNAVTQDGRLMNGQTWSVRTRHMMEGYDKLVPGDDGVLGTADDTYERSAWVLLGYEESKGLGPGEPEEDPETGETVKIEAGDIGKNTKADTFGLDDPSFAKPGHQINAPDIGNPGYELAEDGSTTAVLDPVTNEYLEPPITGIVENDFGELQYATPISRRPALFVNPITKSKLQDDGVTYKGEIVMQPGMTSAVMLYKEGTMNQGGPADIFLRRWVVPDDYDPHVDNPFDLKNLVVDLPDDYEGFAEVPVWLKNDDTEEYEFSHYVSVDTNDANPGDGWDTAIIDGTLDPGYTSWSAYPSFDGITSEYYPNGVMIRGAQNMSSTIPLDIRPLDKKAGDVQSAAETVPAWHLDIMPDLAAKVEDGTLSFTDCASCHPDSWGAADEDGYPAHGILNRVWWWTQVGSSATQTLEDVKTEVWTAATEAGAVPNLDPLVFDAWGENIYDDHWDNRFELSKGHRGFIDGQDVMVMFGYAPNWLLSSHGKEPINLFIRRSFNGGDTWTTTPLAGTTNLDGVDYLGDGTTYDQVQGVGSEDSGRVFFYDEIYEAGDFERMRNVSQFYSSSDTIIDPRYTPTNNRRQTDILRKLAVDQTNYDVVTGRFWFDADETSLDTADPLTVVADDVLYAGFQYPSQTLTTDGTTGWVTGVETTEAEGVGTLDDVTRAAARSDDIRDPSKFFAVYESGDSGPMADGLEADAENLYYSRATNWGDDWESIIWYPSEKNPNALEPYPYWDWLENASDDHSGEAAINASPGGRSMWSTWNQWKVNEETEHEYDFDAMFRRVYWMPELIEPTIITVADVDELSPEEPVEEGEVITLTASSTYTIGDEPVSDERVDNLEYAWDLDSNGSFETLGQTVTMKATGAMQKVLVRATDQSTGANAIDSLYINGAQDTPRVWNVRLVNGNTGLAGTRVALSANFRNPGLRWSHPAPDDYDYSISAVIDWGDGTIEPGSIASKNDGQGSQRFVVGEHKYKKPGLYTVKVTVTNGYGNSGWDYLQYAVIVHRKAGALAMAGTFDDPGGLGEASIAANVKYKLKGKYPSGKVLFTLSDMSFVSEKLDWMAISGRKGWVRGQGQLNGVGGYEFLLSVFDDRKNVNDLVRVKIWKANGKLAGVIYDSQPGSPDEAVAVTPMKTGKITLPLFKGKSWKYYFMKKK